MLNFIGAYYCGETGKRGGEILSVIHSFLQHGDSKSQQITRRIMRIVSQPILFVRNCNNSLVNMVDRWIYNGKLHDPCQEVCTNNWFRFKIIFWIRFKTSAKVCRAEAWTFVCRELSLKLYKRSIILFYYKQNCL